MPIVVVSVTTTKMVEIAEIVVTTETMVATEGVRTIEAAEVTITEIMEVGETTTIEDNQLSNGRKISSRFGVGLYAARQGEKRR